MTNKAKPELELLIRAPGSAPGSSGSFVTKRYVANQVALTVKPKRIDDDEFELQAQSRKDNKVSYVIRVYESERYLFLSEEEYFLWMKMDGLHTLRDVATAFFVKFGSFDFRKIQRFLDRARQDKLIVIAETDLMRKSLAETTVPTTWIGRLAARIRAIDWRLTNVDPRIESLYKRISFLFTRPAYAAYTLLFAGGCASLYKHYAQTGVPIDWLSRVLLSPVLLVMLGATVFVHELAHALACKHFGREVKAFGFTFVNRLIPSVYADVTDIWMSTRKARMAVSFAGPASGIVISSTAAILAYLMPGSMGSSLLWLYALLTMAGAFGSLYPFLFLESDGYHILSDWLRMPALREHGRKFLRERVQQIVKRSSKEPVKTKPLTSDERVYLAYGITSVASIVVIIAATITAIVALS